MEICKSGYQSWAFTIRCNKKKEATEQDILNFVSMMQNKGAVIKDMVFEEDNGTTYHGKHAHGICELKKGFLRKKLMMEGYHIKLEEIYDLKGWIKYMNKHQKAVKVLKCEDEYIPTDEDIMDLKKYQDEVLEKDYSGNLFILAKKLSKDIV